MLQHLAIQNFALVDNLELDLTDGMTVVSGETGAGKSIMLDALALTLGNRADAGSIGLHGDKTQISAYFDIKGNREALAWLKQHDVETQDDECILRRVVTKEGRSRAFINGVPTTLSDLKSLGQHLADIHSQHEHQSLLQRDTHRRLLDEFASAATQAREIRALSDEFSQKSQQLDTILNQSEEQTARKQLLSYQLEEIQALGMKQNETTELEDEQKKLANGETILTKCQAAVSLCQDGQNGGAIELVNQTAVLLAGLDQAEIDPIVEMVRSAQIQLEEAVQDLERFGAGFEINPQRLKDVEERLSAIYDLSRKHRIKPNQITDLTTDIETELEALGDVDGKTAELDLEIERIKSEYSKIAAVLSKKREKAATKIRTAVTKQLALLGMSGAKFSVELTKQEPGTIHPNGLEAIEFLISTNPGQEPKALNKIASGGELSRISLAIQVTTADTSRVPCLVFDEVDVGIGGAVAEVVGALLRELGSKAQIICVTHLAQVAAQGHQHLTVSKASIDKNTTSVVAALDKDGRVQEIARMLGGVDKTKHSVAHAEEMFKSAQA